MEIYLLSNGGQGVLNYIMHPSVFITMGASQDMDTH
jgi:hypothetical protein